MFTYRRFAILWRVRKPILVEEDLSFIHVYHFPVTVTHNPFYEHRNGAMIRP